MFKFSKYFVSLFGLGYVPWIPGTIGSLFTIILLYIFNPYIFVLGKIIIFSIIFIFSLKTINIYSKQITKNDASEIIIDEFLGLFLIFIFYDYIKFTNDFIMFTIIFIVFRFFDILKFYPANWVDKNMKNSFGIILDDLVAGFYSIIILFFVNALL